MKTLLIGLLTGCVYLNTFASERIESAFGKKLGETFDPGSATSTTKMKNGGLMYEFATTNGFRSFTRYYVAITPTTHKIYSIWGVGTAENTTAGRREQSVIMGILREKYGSEFKIGPTDLMGDVKRISQGSRNVLMTLTGTSKVELSIQYYDEDLEKIAEQERLTEETAKIDKSGL